MDAPILDISPAVVWVIALSQLLTFALTVWNMVSSGSRSNARAIERHSETLTHLEMRISAAEKQLEEIPHRKDIHSLELQMSTLRGVMNVLSERLKPTEAIAERMQELMLELKKG